MRLLCLVLALGALLFSHHQGWSSIAVAHWREAVTGRDAATDAAVLEGRTVTSILAARRSLGLGPLAPDIGLQQWLLDRTGADAADSSPETIVRTARLALPQYQELIVLQTRSVTADGLLKQISGWPDLGTRELDHLAAVAEPGPFGLGWSATILVGHKLPMFTPEALLDPKQDTFYSVCTLCRRGQACQIPRHTRSLSLECPHCHRVYAMVAANAKGRFRYVNEFLTGYAPPARYSKGQTKLAELMTIWNTVASGCRYATDVGGDDNDEWQAARETQSLGQGDCEDSSILLADWLLARDFQARVALGRYAERGGHAWVVVHLDGKDYLLESTEGASKAERPPLLAEVGPRYVPEQLFDHLAFYIRKDPGALWNGDFWSEDTWQRVVPRKRFSSDGKEVLASVGAE
jgi:hypothetical protein